MKIKQRVHVLHFNPDTCSLKLQTHLSSARTHTTVDAFIFVGTNFRGLNKYHTFEGFKIRGHGVLLYNSYRKLLFRWY